jgi:hypothetical protein
VATISNNNTTALAASGATIHSVAVCPRSGTNMNNTTTTGPRWHASLYNFGRMHHQSMRDDPDEIQKIVYADHYEESLLF